MTTKAVEAWIRDKTGVGVKLDSRHLGDKLYDGYLLSLILKSYGIVRDFPIVKRNCSPKEAIINIQAFCPWLKFLGVPHSFSFLQGVAEKDSQKCLQLIFALHGRLECGLKYNLSIIEKNNDMKTVFPIRYHRHVDKNPETINPVTIEYLEMKKNIIEKSKKETRLKRDKILNEKIIQEEQIKLNNLNDFATFDRQKIKKPKKLENEILKLRMTNRLLKDLWVTLLRKNEEEFNNYFKTQMNEQCHYEKSMAVRYAQTHHCFESVFEDRPKDKTSNEHIIKNDCLRNFDPLGSTREELKKLHNQLYSQKILEKKTKYQNICDEIVHDLVDFSLNFSEYSYKNGTRPTTCIINDWKEMFFKSIPLFKPSKENFEEIKNTEELSSKYFFYDDTIEVTAIQNETENLAASDVQSYLYLTGDWMVENWPELRKSAEKLNILGFIVNRLLELKYPLIAAFDVSKFVVRSVLYVQDPSFLNLLQKKLLKSQIVVVKFEAALKYCMQLRNQEKASMDETSRKKFKKENKNKKSSIITSFADKSVQHPDLDDQCRVNYSTLATLGDAAKKLMDDCLPLNAILKCQIIVEYLKNLKNCRGFLLADFPTTVSEAVLLEFLITGDHQSGWSIDEESRNFIHTQPNIQNNITKIDLPDFLNETALEVIPKIFDIKKSKISEDEEVSAEVFSKAADENNEENIKKDSENDQTSCEFSDYTKKISFEEMINSGKSKLLPLPNETKELKTIFHSCIASHSVIEDKKLNSIFERSKDLRFFTNLDLNEIPFKKLPPPLNYYHFYNVFNCVTSTDHAMVDQIANFYLRQCPEHEIKAESKKYRSTSVYFPSCSDSRNKLASLEKCIKTDSVQKTASSIFYDKKLPFSLGSPGPGEPGWQYLHEKVEDDLKKNLATRWEVVEQVYLRSLPLIMHLLRIHKTKFFPYINRVESFLKNRIPDLKQQLFSEFQSFINDINQDQVLKTDQHCRLYEFWNALCEMSDTRKNSLKTESRNLHSSGWIMDFSYKLINVYISLMQTEMDRTTDTTQILNTYYLSMLDEEFRNQDFEKIKLERISPCSNSTRESSSDNTSLSDEMLNDLFDPIEIYRLIQPAMIKIAENAIRCKSFVINIFSQRNKAKSTKENTLDFTSIKNIEDLNFWDRTRLEWYTAVSDESDRLQFRIKLIELKMKEDLIEYLRIAKETYTVFEARIAVRYNNEIRLINQLFNHAKKCIENGCGLPSPLVDEKFLEIMDSSFSLDVPPPTPNQDVSEEYTFSISELNNFIKKMKQVAPSGWIDKTFVSILEDMVTFTSDENHHYVPNSWSNINRQDIIYLLSQIFGDSGFYNWVDFVIFNMCVSEPTVEELVKLKVTYRNYDLDKTGIISSEMFFKIPLWFEYHLSDTFSKKQIIFKLFQTSLTQINYLVFLFSFCKGEDGLEGFMKALTLIDDKGIMLDVESYKEKLIDKHEACIAVDQAITRIIHDAVQKSEQVWNSKNSDSDISVRLIKDNGPEPTYPERYNHPKWCICFPQRLVLGLLMFAWDCRISDESIQIRKELRRKIDDLYQNKGKKGFVRGFVLAESDCLKFFFEKTRCYKWCDMSRFVEFYLRQKNINICSEMVKNHTTEKSR